MIRFGLSLMVAELQKLYVIDLILSGRASNLIAMSRFVRVLADLCELGNTIPMRFDTLACKQPCALSVES